MINRLFINPSRTIIPFLMIKGLILPLIDACITKTLFFKKKEKKVFRIRQESFPHQLNKGKIKFKLTIFNHIRCNSDV